MSSQSNLDSWPGSLLSEPQSTKAAEFSVKEQQQSALALISRVLDYLCSWPFDPQRHRLIQEVDSYLQSNRHNLRDATLRAGAARSPTGLLMIARLLGNQLWLRLPRTPGSAPNTDVMAALNVGLSVELGLVQPECSSDPTAQATALLARVISYLKSHTPHPMTTRMVGEIEAYLRDPKSHWARRFLPARQAASFTSGGLLIMRARLIQSRLELSVPAHGAAPGRVILGALNRGLKLELKTGYTSELARENLPLSSSAMETEVGAV